MAVLLLVRFDSAGGRLALRPSGFTFSSPLRPGRLLGDENLEIIIL